jgi:hypothetical protein
MASVIDPEEWSDEDAARAQFQARAADGDRYSQRIW